jgi:hypothetical protein
MEVRKCCGCGKTHPLTNEFFHVCRKDKSGYAYRCKVCTNTKNREKKLAERLSSEKYKVKMREEATGMRVCRVCGIEKDLTLFTVHSKVLVNGTRKKYRKGFCNLCRQIKRNKGRRSKPKIRPAQILVQVKGKTSKQCSACKKIKEVDKFYKSNQTVTGFSHICGKCLRARKNADYARDPAKANAIKRAWDAKNVEKVREQDKIRGERYRAKPEKRELLAKARKLWVARNLERTKAHSKKRADELTDAYVKHLLCAGPGGKRIPKSKWPEIPQELIEVKRMHLKLKRAVEEKG